MRGESRDCRGCRLLSYPLKDLRKHLIARRDIRARLLARRFGNGAMAQRVRWMRLLVRKFGAERVGYGDDADEIGGPEGSGIPDSGDAPARRFEPPAGWTYEEWSARKALRA